MTTEKQRIWRRAWDNKRNRESKRRKAWKKAYDAEYVARPEVIARRKIYDASPERVLARKMSILRREYGITPEQYNEMFFKQNGLDAITGLPLLKGFSTDHCHKNGKFRGLLNCKINSALGLFQDNPAWLRAAADYIEKNA